MSSIVPRSLWIAIGITVILLSLLLLFILMSSKNLTPMNQVEYYKLYLEAFQVIAVGFGVAVLGVLVPAILTDARQRFEKTKESRNAYSQVKTGVDYLPLRLCSLNLKEAVALIQALHVRKHQVELYEELPQWLERRYEEGDIRRNTKVWTEIIYYRLSKTRELLEENAGSWDGKWPADRLKLLQEVKPLRMDGEKMTELPAEIDCDLLREERPRAERHARA